MTEKTDSFKYKNWESLYRTDVIFNTEGSYYGKPDDVSGSVWEKNEYWTRVIDNLF